MGSDTKHVVSLFHTPSPAARQAFYCVVRAGWLKAASDYRIARSACSGHDLLFCLKGAGFIRSRTISYAVKEGALAWIDGYHPHAHWAAPQRPWELYWLRMDAPWLDATCKLLSIHRRPVFEHVDRRKVSHIYDRIFHLMTRRPPALEALVHAEAARLIAHLFEVRQSERSADWSDERELPPELQAALTQMSLYPHRPWRLAELARLSGLSVAHFCRRFQQVFHAPPIDWLRRERINRAQRRLLECQDPIKEIAGQVGYQDQFHFSRDFKRYTGFSPSEFRRHEPRVG